MVFLQLKEIERLRDRVAELQGNFMLKILPPTGRGYYMLSLDSKAREARYVKVTACPGDQRETVEETWLSNMFDVLNTEGVAVRVEFSYGSNSAPIWFDTDLDEQALRKMYSLLLSDGPNPT